MIETLESFKSASLRLLAFKKLVNYRKVFIGEAASVHDLVQLMSSGAQRCARLAIMCRALSQTQIFGQVLFGNEK